MGAPAISVIVVPDTYRDSFPAGLEGLVAQSVDPGTFEIIVVDWVGGRSCAPLVEQVRAHPGAPRIVHDRCPRRGRAALNNRGVALAAAPLLCFLGDDIVPDPGYVAAHLAYHDAHPEETSVAIGPAVSPDEQRAASPFLAWLEDSGELFGARFRDPAAPLPPAYFYVGNASLRRSLYERAGGFDERLPFPALDDAQFGHRLRALGVVAELLPEARCIHDHLVTLADRRVQLDWAGASAAILRASRSRGGWRDLLRVHARRLREWTAAALRDPSRTALWRLALTAAYLEGYRRQSRAARGPDAGRA